MGRAWMVLAVVAVAGCGERKREALDALEAMEVERDGACALQVSWSYGRGNACVDTLSYEVIDADGVAWTGEIGGQERERVDTLDVAAGDAAIHWEVVTVDGNRMQLTDPFACPDVGTVDRYVLVDC